MSERYFPFSTLCIGLKRKDSKQLVVGWGEDEDSGRSWEHFKPFLRNQRVGIKEEINKESPHWVLWRFTSHASFAAIRGPRLPGHFPNFSCSPIPSFLSHSRREQVTAKALKLEPRVTWRACSNTDLLGTLLEFQIQEVLGDAAFLKDCISEKS